MQNLIILLPLIGAAVIGLGGLMSPGFRKQESLIGTLGTLAVALPFALIVLARLSFNADAPTTFSLFTWMSAGDFSVNFGYNLDALGMLMGMVVTGVGALIHMYSIGYMKGDPGFYKFFAYLNLFIFAMLNLILGDNLVVMFLGWEGVGMCSYLLIGFWYTDMIKAKAAQKAFVANRIGDFALLIAMFMIWPLAGSLNFSDIVGAGIEGDAAFWIALLVFIAATGKSAQIPLFVWLPDAMAGPTPVSALIHAATMVTSGIYLIARLHPIFIASPEVMMIIAVVAAATALVAALTALAQNDIKKVLAYSTVSQLGFMFMALGAGAFTAAIFHVMTHAFFKACLFLGSGSVIHGMEHMHTVDDPQDIRTMGGLRKYMPATRMTFLISTLAISGIPLLSGFFSKDEILASTFFAGNQHMIYYLVWGVGALTAFLTAFYMTRVYFLTFEGESRFPDTKKPHESPTVMTLPLWVLAGLAVVGGFVGLPYVITHGHGHILNDWLTQSGAHLGTAFTVAETVVFEEFAKGKAALEWGLIAFSIAIAVIGVFSAWRFYKKNSIAGDDILERRFGGLYDAWESKFYFDELYQIILIRPYEWFSRQVFRKADEQVVDGLVNGTGTAVTSAGEVLRRLQSGLVQNYATILSAGVLAVVSWLIFG
ncbi:MAG: NADH-quinone oxidoreductase subunit L [Bacteroidia bacterium]